MTMLDIAGGILIAAAPISLIALGRAGLLSDDTSGAGWFILVGFAAACAVIFHSYIPTAY